MRTTSKRGLQHTCLKQSRITAHTASRIPQLSGEILAALGNDDDDHLFLTLDDDENE